ncbi:N-acetylmuramoyl-L-alanine amidase [Aliihoeflea sp. PC F10.4]
MTGFVCDYCAAEPRVSPNFGPRPDAAQIDSLIIHYTGMPTGEGAEARLCDTESAVSSHYIIHEDGRVVQMVREADRAWHAGQSFWRGCRDMNSCSIGIEIVNPGHDGGLPDFPDVQIDAVIALCGDILSRHSIVSERVLAHSDVAPGRKIDPGERFPWDRLAAAGIGHHVDPGSVQGGRFLAAGDQGEPVEALQSMLALYGYDVEINSVFDPQTHRVVEAFQRHFRQKRVDGVADRSTIETLHRLLSTLPSGLATR